MDSDTTQPDLVPETVTRRKLLRGSILAGAANVINSDAQGAAAFMRELDRKSYKQARGDALPKVEPQPPPSHDFAEIYRVCRGELFVGGTWKCVRKIAFGSTSVVYLAYSVDLEREAAVKVCSFSKGDESLVREFQIYGLLKDGPGIPRVHWFGQEHQRHFLVMELLGPNLADLQRFCGGRFSLKTVCMLGVQIFEVMDWTHKSGFIHREMKPQNFCLGHGPSSRHVFLVDFATAITFRPKLTIRGESYIPRVVGTRLKGQAVYDSIGAHYGNEHSYRDDLESVLYMLSHFLLGDLPWKGMSSLPTQSTPSASETKPTYDKICDLKLALNFVERVPSEMQAAFEHLRNLRYEDLPDYELLVHLFLSMLRNEKHQFDHEYDWTPSKQNHELASRASHKKNILSKLIDTKVRKILSLQTHHDPFVKHGQSFEEFVHDQAHDQSFHPDYPETITETSNLNATQ